MSKDGEGSRGEAIGGLDRIAKLFILEKRRLREDLIVVCSFLTRGCKGAGIDVFSVMTRDRKWSQHQAGQSSRDIWTMLLCTSCESGAVLCRARS